MASSIVEFENELYVDRYDDNACRQARNNNKIYRDNTYEWKNGASTFEGIKVLQVRAGQRGLPQGCLTSEHDLNFIRIMRACRITKADRFLNAYSQSLIRDLAASNQEF